MSFEFQSTLVNITPTYRISGNQIGGVRIETNGGIKVARVIVTNDVDVKFALTGPYETGDPDAIYAALAADLYELAPGVLINEGAVSSVEIEPEKIVIDLEGSDRKFTFLKDEVVTEVTESADHTWKLTVVGFTALGTAAGTWRSSMDGTLEGLSTAITTEVADRIAAITAEEQRVDALIASGMWLFATQGDFPPAADNHGRVVHSHADGAIFYAHGGMWHKIENEAEAQAARDVIQADVDQNEADADAAIAAEAATREANDTTIIASVANEASARQAADISLQAGIDAEAATRASGDVAEANTRSGADAALSARLDTLEADPTTATAVAAGDAATLSSANSYTDTAVSNVIGSAPGVLDTLGEIADAINDDANVYTTLVSQIAAVQSDVDGNETDSDAAEAALSARLDTLEADPTTATALAAVQSDVDQNESDGDAADAALSARLDTLEADPTTAAAVAAVQSDVDQNESDADAADAALSARLDVLEADPTTATAVAAVQSDVDANEVSRKAVIDIESNITSVKNAVRGTSIAVGNNITLNPASGGRVEIEGDLLLDNATDVIDGAGVTLTSFTNINAYDGRLDTLEADPTTATALAAVQADVDQNEVDGDAADAALSGRLDVLEADPTTATAVAAVQADVDQNEADSDTADAALSARLDTLEADPTTATAVAAVQADVDSIEAAAATARTNLQNTLQAAIDAVQADVDTNESDADTALAGKLGLGGGTLTGNLLVNRDFPDFELRSNSEKRVLFTDAGGGATGAIKNVSSSVDIYAGGVAGGNKEMSVTASGVEIMAALTMSGGLTDAADDTAAAAAGVAVNQLYRNGSVVMIRVS